MLKLVETFDTGKKLVRYFLVRRRKILVRYCYLKAGVDNGFSKRATRLRGILL